MTMDDARLLLDYWQDHPPTHLLVAAFMGRKPRSESDLASLLGADPNAAGPQKMTMH